MKTQALVVVSLADLIAMDGDSVLAEKWLAAHSHRPRDQHNRERESGSQGPPSATGLP